METEGIFFTKTFVAHGEGPDQNKADLSVSDVQCLANGWLRKQRSMGLTDMSVDYESVCQALKRFSRSGIRYVSVER
jgi:hypothetical protein